MSVTRPVAEALATLEKFRRMTDAMIVQAIDRPETIDPTARGNLGKQREVADAARLVLEYVNEMRTVLGFIEMQLRGDDSLPGVASAARVALETVVAELAEQRLDRARAIAFSTSAGELLATIAMGICDGTLSMRGWQEDGVNRLRLVQQIDGGTREMNVALHAGSVLFGEGTTGGHTAAEHVHLFARWLQALGRRDGGFDPVAAGTAYITARQWEPDVRPEVINQPLPPLPEVTA